MQRSDATAGPVQGYGEGIDDPTSAAFAGAVRAQLARMLRAEKLEASERNRRFLEYVVDEALTGRAPRRQDHPDAADDRRAGSDQGCR
jgi:hypothetical protein